VHALRTAIIVQAFERTAYSEKNTSRNR